MAGEATYRITVHLEDGSYWAEVQELPGCFAAGDTMDELREAIAEAMSLYLSTDAVKVTVQVGEMALDESTESFDTKVLVG